MELVKKIGGFGIIQMDVKEVMLMENVRELAGNQNRYTLGSENKETAQFMSLIKDLFPHFPLRKSSEYSKHFTVYAQETENYTNVPRSLVVSVRSHFGLHPLGRSGHGVDLDLVFPKNNPDYKYPITVALDYNYHPDSLDDIAKLLGQREKPILEVASLIMLNSNYHQWTRYGLADAPRLGPILRLYDRADELLEKSDKTIGVSKEELAVLRRDYLEHESLVIRDLSRERYQKELQRLVNH